MNITWKRNYPLVLTFLALFFAWVFFSQTKIISYNFWEHTSVIEAEDDDYENSIDLFDTSIVHEIELSLSPADYANMVVTYQETGEKDYYETDITIDGVTIPSVWVRLKGNSTLRTVLGGEGNGQDVVWGGGGGGWDDARWGWLPPDIDLDNPRLPPGVTLPDNWAELSDIEKTETLTTMMTANRGGGAQWGETWGPPGQEESELDGNPPYLIKFNEYIDGQSYQWIKELAIRLGGDDSALGEPIAFGLHAEYWQIVPRVSYASVTVADNETSLYTLAENIDKTYLKRYFPDTDGVLYKAGNFVWFSYLGDDPVDYDEVFYQETSENDDDLSPLIDFLDFVSNSSDDVFASDLWERMDIDSFVTMMALDELLGNTDSFWGVGSNYYIYYNKDEEKFYFLSWDQNSAIIGMRGGGGWDTWIQTQQAPPWDVPPGSNTGTTGAAGAGGPPLGWVAVWGQWEAWVAWGQWVAWWSRGWQNDLKERFLANTQFADMYNSRLAELRADIFGEDGTGSALLEDLISTVEDYLENSDIMEVGDYDTIADTYRNYFLR